MLQFRLLALHPSRQGLRLFSSTPSGPLKGIRVLDMTRVLAGPSGTQLLADMGAEVIKVERPKVGDDTRQFAPPFLPKSKGGKDSEMSAYFAGINRNKHSMTLNYSTKAGQEVLKRLLAKSDVIVENFKTGTLDKYNLGYSQIKDEFPKLVYCSVTGFGHTGPYKDRPGYDALIQAQGGIMSITGVPDGEPMKVGISMCDLAAGLHGVIGILAALRHAEATGEGQHVDIGMLDVTVAMLANQGMNYLATKKRQPRLGNNHPNIVPYQVMPSSDGFFILSVGNDPTFERFCQAGGCEHLLQDEKCRTAVARVTNRVYVTEKCNAVTMQKPTKWWLENLEKAKVGCSPILHPDEVFADPHVQAREMVVQMQVPGIDEPADLIASPMKFSKTQVDYRMPPPLLGEHSDHVLDTVGYSAEDITKMREDGTI